MNSDQQQHNYHDAMEKFLMPQSMNAQSAGEGSKILALKEILNASQENIKLADLELGKQYEITDGKIIKTVLGNKARLVLNNKYKLLLPDRYSEMLTNESMQTLVKNEIKLVYKGKKELYNNKSKHDIEFV